MAELAAVINMDSVPGYPQLISTITTSFPTPSHGLKGTKVMNKILTGQVLRSGARPFSRELFICSRQSDRTVFTMAPQPIPVLRRATEDGSGKSTDTSQIEEH